MNNERPFRPANQDQSQDQPDIADAYAGQYTYNVETPDYSQSASPTPDTTTPATTPATGAEVIQFPKVERTPDKQKAEKAISQIEHAIDVAQEKLRRNENQRGIFGRMLKAVKERVLNMQTEDKKIETQLQSLRALRNQVEANPDVADQAIDIIKREHGGAVIASASNREVTNLAERLMENATEQGLDLSDAEATAKAQQFLDDQAALEEQFFAEGDRYNKEGELNTEAADIKTEQYQAKRSELAGQQTAATEQLQATAPSKKETIRAKYEEAFEKIEEIAGIERKGKGSVAQITAEQRAIADWFDGGLYRNMMIEMQATDAPATDPAAELYQAELKRGAKSTKAQTMAFEKFMSGELTTDELTAKLGKIRKELGPGLVIDHALRGGADHDLAQARIVAELRQQKRFPELHKYGPSEIEVYRTMSTVSPDHISEVEVSIVLKPEHRIIVLRPEDLGTVGIAVEDAERLLQVDPTELANYVANEKTAANNAIEYGDSAAAK